MQEVDGLLSIADRLLGQEGCSWSREQTFSSLQKYLLEEVHELIEAIDEGSGPKMAEELGDVMYTLVFLAKLGEQKGLFTFREALKEVSEKLIRRHPHVFGKLKVSSSEEIAKNWEEIKKTEAGRTPRKDVFDGIPPTLPTLLKAEKIAHRLHKSCSLTPTPLSEERLGEILWEIVVQAEREGLSPEAALRKKLQGIQSQKR